ncbi:hypothetical protein HG535_0A04820 [Zygotorulaspora mrakii]|uniref:Uncharacterized protein n=1 Tax=Zygotorulaspora mrakii TaxID=42260 RepID=A0A7H9AWA5_ZYGMR|nr:uncharacterized protein HG535_0A04820 [Zygotorulaspora mrakii]QLG70541.1 hypothetical protein HG535_0A04820 [Zygotorulaspora mrakii]
MSSNGSQDMLKKQQLPDLDVDWLVGARNLDLTNGNITNVPSNATGGNVRSRSGSLGSGERSGGLMSPQPVDLSKRYARRNSVASPPSNSASSEKSNTQHSKDKDSNLSLRRTKSLSAAAAEDKARDGEFHSRRRGASISRASLSSSGSSSSLSHGGEKKMGFFKSLFGRMKSKPEVSSDTQVPQSNQRPKSRASSISTPALPDKRRSSLVNESVSHDKNQEQEEDIGNGVPLTRSKTESLIQDHNRHHHDSNKNIFNDDMNQQNEKRSSDGGNVSNEQEDWDPRLMEFLQYYKSKGYSVSAFQKNSNPSTISSKKIYPRRSGRSTSFSLDVNTSDLRKPNALKVKYDARGQPLPPHPSKSKLSPALKTHSNCKTYSGGSSDSDSDSESSSPSTATPSSSHKFGAFLRRVTSYGASNSNNNVKDEVSSLRSTQTSKDPFDPGKADVVPGLEDIKPLKYVSFAVNTYFNDPPQQICSKHPRQGEVEVKPNGSVVIHRLTPEEKRIILESSSTGVVVGGSGQLKLLIETDSHQGDDVRKKEEMAPSVRSETDDKVVSPSGEMREAEQKRNIGRAAVETAETARERGLKDDSSSSKNEEDVTVSNIASRVTIDKPMISRRTGGEQSQTSLSSMISQESEEEVFPPKKMKIPYDIVYTRCCHLREILPIPATMKQLKKGSTDPIPLLQLRNPRPSMIEIWSFSDFLSIAPVLCLSLDGVSLSVDMLRTILSALTFKKNFEKLSLRNTPLDHEGWKILCYFVSKSKSLVALDLTMVPSIKTNVQKPSKSSLKNNMPRMECDTKSRRDMNWNLLAASVATKGGLEEVIISGAQMPSDQFSNFIEVACIATTRLGLAYNRLTKAQCDKLANWIVQSKVTGLDIGFNDLNGKLSGFIDAIVDKIHNKGKSNVFKYISFNCTGLEVGPNDTSETNEVLKLISILCYFENLKFLDISNNPKMFPHCMKTLINCLPVFVNLVRLHLDYENLSSTLVVMLAEVLPLCSRLNYLSILGTKFDLASCKALADAVRKSSSLITLDIDYTYMPANIREKVSLYTMRNVDSELNKVKSESGKPSDDKDQLSTLQDELSVLLTDDFKDKELYDKLVERYIERVTIARSKIRKVVKDLFDTRVKGQLSTEGKETLIRLCFIEASFEKGLRLLKDRHKAKLSSAYTDAYDSVKTDGPFPTIFESITEGGRSLANKAPKTDEDSSVPASTVLSSSTFEQSGHSMLLPFSKADVEEFNPHADDTIELHEDDRESSNKISMQGREEGSIFRSGTALTKKVHDNRSNNGNIVDLNYLENAGDSLKTDQIKDLLLKTDMSSVVNVIDELHSKGYHLHDIFKKHDSETHKKLVDLSPQTSLNDGDDTSSSNTETDEKIKTGKDSSISSVGKSTTATADNSEADEAIDAAYDQVLDSIQRDRKPE